MTNKEAIITLKTHPINSDLWGLDRTKYLNALEVAIEALQRFENAVEVEVMNHLDEVKSETGYYIHTGEHTFYAVPKEQDES